MADVNTAALRRQQWLQVEAEARAEAETYRRQLHALREAREQLDAIWSTHPDWTFAQVCAQYQAEHPEVLGEGAA